MQQQIKKPRRRGQLQLKVTEEEEDEEYLKEEENALTGVERTRLMTQTF